MLLFYWIYSKNGRGKFVVEERKLLIRGSFCLSVIWAILFFVITVTMFLSLAFMGKYMYQLVEPMSRMVFGELYKNCWPGEAESGSVSPGWVVRQESNWYPIQGCVLI